MHRSPRSPAALRIIHSVAVSFAFAMAFAFTLVSSARGPALAAEVKSPALEDGGRLTFRRDAGGLSVTLGDEPLLSVEAPSPNAALPSFADDALVLEGKLPAEGMGPGLALHVVHSIEDAARIHVPHLAPAEGYVMGDHSFRSPAIVLAGRKLALALVPDLDDIAAGHAAGWRTWLDYDHPARAITLAAGDYEVAREHVLYRSKPVAQRGQAVRLRLHVIASERPEDLADPFGLAARWIWARWGHLRHVAGGSQLAPLAKYSEYVTRWAFTPEGWGETVWQTFEIGGKPCGAPAFIVDVAQHPSIPMAERRWREQRSVWNQAWFSTQRCANGLLRHARRLGSKDLEEKARLATELALAAPRTDGLFPSVYTTARPKGGGWYQLYRDTPGWDEGRWTNSDRRPSGMSAEACHTLDAAFTARMLLEWHGLTSDARAVEMAAGLGDRLLRLQRPSGAFPGWVEPEGRGEARVPAGLDEGPETAVGATLLFELAALRPERKDWLAAAFKAADYLVAGPVAEGRWEDFETYFSCSRWGSDRIGKIVERSGVSKRNTLSPYWCAETFLAAHRASGRDRWLALGRRCLDELSLYQQAWDPPFIAAPCHGGFGVMNSDGEWNDARQSLFAPLYLEYGRATGVPEYFERGIAALRASFALLYCPENDGVRKQYELKHPFFGPESYGFLMENIAHGGPAPADGSSIGPFTIYTWGNGAALEAAAKIHDLYGDVYVDVARGAAFGIDGADARLEDGKLLVRDRFGRSSLLAVFSTGERREVPLARGDGASTSEGRLSLDPPRTQNRDLWELAGAFRDVHRVSTLFTAQDVRGHLSSPEGLDRAIAWCRESGVRRVFIESFRDGYTADREALVRARDRFLDAGFEVSGCITPTQVGKKSTGWNIISCYTDEPTQVRVREIFEYAAGLFDEIMVDDFWFTDCSCTACDSARLARTVTVGGTQHPVAGDTWEDYRSELLVELSRTHVLAAAKRVNPRAEVIIKYPQWYDRFHERGYDVARETRDFDRIWVGTETRDYGDARWGGTVQYEAYFIMRWLGGIGGDRCGGGWFDPYGTTERTYLEQARQTVLAGARESLLFCYGSLLRETGPRNIEVFRENVPELLEVARQVSHRRPVGIAALKPIASHPDTEARVFDFVGMLGIPLVPCHELPAAGSSEALPPGTRGAFLSIHALKDPLFAAKFEALAARGTPLLITDGLARRLVDLRVGKPDLEQFPSMKILECRGEPKSLLEIAREDLDRIRAQLLRDLRFGDGAPVSFHAPARVGFYLFHDGSWVVENFRDEAAEVEVAGEQVRVEARGWVCRWK